MSLLESHNGTRPVSVLSSTLAAPAETADRVAASGTLAERAFDNSRGLAAESSSSGLKRLPQ